MNEASVSVNTKRGRPATHIEWPDKPFTIVDIKNQVGDKLSKVAIQIRVKSAVDKKLLVIKGKQQTTGRPRVIYSRAEISETVSA